MKALRPHLLALAVMASGVVFPQPARAEVLVYNLSVSNILTNVNFNFVQGGLLVLDPVGGTFSTALVITDPDTLLPFYSTSVLSGTYTTILSENNNNEYAVLIGTSTSSGADSLSFQLIGALSSGVRVGGGTTADVARQMRGVLMASAAQDSTTDAASVETLTYGFAGQSRVRADLDAGITRDVNNGGLDLAAALELVAARLANLGISAQASPSPTASPAATSSATATPSPTP